MLTRTSTNHAPALLLLATLSFLSPACSVAPRAGAGRAGAAPADTPTAAATRGPLDFDGYVRAEYDAARGRAARLITPAQESAIAAAWERRAPTLEKTRLGGGIGFHGRAREWEDSGPRHLSRGCVVLHLSDISDFYDQVPEGAMVVIF